MSVIAPLFSEPATDSMPTITQPLTEDSLAAALMGKTVTVRRDLNNKHWCTEVRLPDGTTKLMRRPELDDVAVQMSIVDVRPVPAIQCGLAAREASVYVRLSNGYWYDTATGLQDGTGATYYEISEA